MLATVLSVGSPVVTIIHTMRGVIPAGAGSQSKVSCIPNAGFDHALAGREGQP
jgi:hypothetical protein